MEWTLTHSTTPAQSGPWSNDHGVMTLHCPKVQNSTLSIVCFFFVISRKLVGGGLTSLQRSIIIIIIMSRRQHGYPWLSLATSPYHSSPPAGLQGYILCPHIGAVCKFVLVVLLLHIHMWGSTGVHRLWARPCFFRDPAGVFYCPSRQGGIWFQVTFFLFNHSHLFSHSYIVI